MIRTLHFALAGVFFACAGSLNAGIVFEFGNGGQSGMDVDGFMSQDTVVMGLTANVSTNSGVLNQGDVNFGINSDEENETTFIDDDNIDEVLTISFSKNVFVNSFQTSGGNSATDVLYSVGSFSDTFSQISDAGSVTTSFANSGQLLLAGQTFTIQQESGATGFSFDQITVSRVPEPTTFTLFGIASFGLLIVRKRRRYTV